jgi:hypothetical protein
MRRFSRKAIVLVQLVTVMGTLALGSAIIELDTFATTVHQATLAAVRLSAWSLADSAMEALPHTNPVHFDVGPCEVDLAPMRRPAGAKPGLTAEARCHVRRKLAGRPVEIDVFRWPAPLK